MRRLTADAPISSRTRTTSALDVGSTMRARTSHGTRHRPGRRTPTAHTRWSRPPRADQRTSLRPGRPQPRRRDGRRPLAAQATPLRRSSPQPRPFAPGSPKGPPGPRRPDLGTAVQARLPAATRARHRYARTPRARSARPADPGALRPEPRPPLRQSGLCARIARPPPKASTTRFLVTTPSAIAKRVNRSTTRNHCQPMKWHESGRALLYWPTCANARCLPGWRRGSASAPLSRSGTLR